MSNSPYSEALLEHANHPSHEGEIPGADYMKTATNSSCGDEITLTLKLKDGQVVDAAWEGNGCAISKASADILCDTLLGKYDEISTFDEIANRLPGRAKCVQVAFDTLRDAPPTVIEKILSI